MRPRRASPFGLVAALACFLGFALALGAMPVASGQSAPAVPVVGAVSLVGITVGDMERSLAFYTGVLGFEKVSDVEVAGDAYERLQGVFALRLRIVRLRLGDEMLELHEYLAPRGRSVPADSRSNDHWFQHVAIIVSDMERAYAQLRRHRVGHLSPGPQRLPEWNPQAGGIQAFYFQDPDGHPLEVLQFPAGKGQAKWHRATDRVFLGIDHTAIVVADTGTSLGFYRDRLGLRVVGTSENFGPEQERLNAVFGARLRITTLAAARGPRIELLEYLAPRTGRPLPRDVRPNDVVHSQTRLTAEGGRIAAVVRDLSLISPGLVALPDRRLGFSRAALVRDPDGHAIQLAEE